MKSSNVQAIVEQVALLFASFTWTVVVLIGIALFWTYQDVQARWEFVLNAPPEALAQAAPPTATPSPTATLWAGPGPTSTPTPPQPPTPTATWVVQPPDILPETFISGEPTPNIVAEDNALIEPPDANPQTSPPTAQAPENVTSTSTQPVTVPQTNDTAPIRLVIDSVDIDSKIVPVGWRVIEQNGRQYSIWDVADYAVGWHKTSALLGQPGNTVMSGHNNVKGEVFRDLVNVEVGDKIVAYAGEQKFEYEITFKTIVKEKGEPPEVRRRNAEWIAPTDDERLTLVTCWPYTSNTHRLIVVAQPT